MVIDLQRDGTNVMELLATTCTESVKTTDILCTVERERALVTIKITHFPSNTFLSTFNMTVNTH